MWRIYHNTLKKVKKFTSWDNIFITYIIDKTSCQLSHKESPRIPEWVAYPFSSKSLTQKLNWGPCIAGRFFTNWAIREAQDNMFTTYIIDKTSCQEFINKKIKGKIYSSLEKWAKSFAKDKLHLVSKQVWYVLPFWGSEKCKSRLHVLSHSVVSDSFVTP